MRSPGPPRALFCQCEMGVGMDAGVWPDRETRDVGSLTRVGCS